MSDQPLVSIVVTTRNSAATLERLLVSIRSQTYEPIELIVVDNSSTDDTAAIAASHADVVLDRGPERSAQRNAGVGAASGRYALIVDSDMIVEPQTVSECVAEAERTGAAALVVPESTIGGGRLAAIRALERSCYEGDETIEAARFFVRDVFLDHGGYDERLHAGEDWDLPARIRRDGGTIGRVAAARILHDEDGARLLPHLRKKYYYGRSLGRYAREHPALARRQATIIRPAFIRHWRRLARRPGLAAALVGLKAAEAVAGASGLVADRLRGPR